MENGASLGTDECSWGHAVTGSANMNQDSGVFERPYSEAQLRFAREFANGKLPYLPLFESYPPLFQALLGIDREPLPSAFSAGRSVPIRHSAFADAL